MILFSKRIHQAISLKAAIGAGTAKRAKQHGQHNTDQMAL